MADEKKLPTITGRWASGGPIPRSNSPAHQAGGEFVFPRHARIPTYDLKFGDDTFIQFKHGEPGPASARKSQLDVYKSAMIEKKEP